MTNETIWILYSIVSTAVCAFIGITVFNLRFGKLTVSMLVNQFNKTAAKFSGAFFINKAGLFILFLLSIPFIVVFLFQYFVNNRIMFNHVYILLRILYLPLTIGALRFIFHTDYGIIPDKYKYQCSKYLFYITVLLVILLELWVYSTPDFSISPNIFSYAIAIIQFIFGTVISIMLCAGLMMAIFGEECYSKL